MGRRQERCSQWGEPYVQRPCERKELGEFEELKEGRCTGGRGREGGERKRERQVREMRQDKSLVITEPCHGFGTSLFLS